MWISGRRAVRPDRDYYRNVRRIRLRSSRTHSGFIQWGNWRIELISLALLMLLSLIGWLFFH